jgi:hypothetical protein
MIRRTTPDELAQLLASRGMNAPYRDEAFVVEQGAYKMLVVLFPLDDTAAEVHICCPREYLPRFRKMCEEATRYIASLDIETLYTTIDDSLRIIINSAIKQGYALHSKSGSLGVYVKHLNGATIDKTE